MSFFNNIAPKKAWTIALSVVFIGLLIDQIIKVYVKTHFVYGETYPLLGDWFKIYFIENDGMAYGITLFGGGKVGKLFLTFFRIAVSIFGFFYLKAMIREKSPFGLIFSISLILTGAIGNIIDSVFYGVIFDDINGYVASWFEGHVVDMFYAPLWEGVLPEWIPFSGGEHFVFFAPIWNFADACITVGVATLLIARNQFELPSVKIVFPKKAAKDPSSEDSEG